MVMMAIILTLDMPGYIGLLWIITHFNLQSFHLYCLLEDPLIIHQRSLPMPHLSHHQNFPSQKPSKLSSTVNSSPPSDSLTNLPSNDPTIHQSSMPSAHPSFIPSEQLSNESSIIPSRFPTLLASMEPTNYPSVRPSKFFPESPTVMPSQKPSKVISSTSTSSNEFSLL